MKDQQYYTDLDMQLRNLAINDWVTFSQLLGDEAIIAAKICMLRAQNRSLMQIGNKLSISKRKAQWANDNHCNCVNQKPNTNTSQV